MPHPGDPLVVLPQGGGGWNTSVARRPQRTAVLSGRARLVLAAVALLLAALVGAMHVLPTGDPAVALTQRRAPVAAAMDSMPVHLRADIPVRDGLGAPGSPAVPTGRSVSVRLQLVAGGDPGTAPAGGAECAGHAQSCQSDLTLRQPTPKSAAASGLTDVIPAASMSLRVPLLRAGTPARSDCPGRRPPYPARVRLDAGDVGDPQLVRGGRGDVELHVVGATVGGRCRARSCAGPSPD